MLHCPGRPIEMILPRFWFITLFVAAVIFYADQAAGKESPPACSVNCTLTTLDRASCKLTDIRNCLCTNDNLQYELSLCVFVACDHAEQIVASEIFRNQICKGVPHMSRKTEILRAEIILAAFTFPIVALRLISRVWVAKKVWWDDWMVLLAAMFMVPMMTIPIYTAYQDLGEHIWNIPAQNTGQLQLLYFIASLIYVMVQNFAKLSILLLYLRIFPSDRFRVVVKVAIAWQILHSTIFVFILIFQCSPVRSSWNFAIDQKCVNPRALVLTGAFLSIFEDIFIMLIPISQLKILRLSLRKRIALCFMFAVGSLACITSIVRLKFVWNYATTIDDAWDHVDATLWSDIEACTAVICSCLITIRPLLVKCFPSLFESTRPSASEPSPESFKVGQNLGKKVRDMWSGSSSSTGLNSGSTSIGSRNAPENLDEGCSQESTSILQGTRGCGKIVEEVELEDTMSGIEVVSADDVGPYGDCKGVGDVEN